MLSKLTVTNFMSYKDRTIFDFKNTNYKILEKRNTYENTLKGAFFIGSNASGKTNAIKAIRFLLEGIFSIEMDFNKYFCIFSENNKMELEYEFHINGSNIVYKIVYSKKDEKLSEELLLDNETIMSRLFDSATTKLTEKENYTNIESKELFLKRLIISSGVDSTNIKKWFEYLENSVFVDGGRGYMVLHKKYNLYEYLKNEGTSRINKFLNTINYNQSINLKEDKLIEQLSSRDKMKYAIEFRRNGIKIGFPYAIESQGNQSFVNFLPMLFKSIDNPSMLIIDEFSSGFHNYLESVLIKYFMKESNNSQMFIVSHSTNLISTSIYRPDQIYSVNFLDEKGSVINRISDYKPRESQNLEKMYLNGKFSGIPHYSGDFNEIK